MGGGKSGRWSAPETDLESKSVLSRLLSKCTVKEPTYDEVTKLCIVAGGRARLRTGSEGGSQY